MPETPEPTEATYRGRFAPSPTGPLHFGSLIAAVGSYLDARCRGGEWLVRVEDVDEPRNVPGADRQILDALRRFGMEWDQPVVYQSQRIHRYRSALDSLSDAGWIYPCACSRKEIGGPVYPGTCRPGLAAGKSPRSLRMRTDEQPIGFRDAIQGPFAQNLEKDVGDFVVRRADGLFAYQLAVVVDDTDQAVTSVVRGSDLLDSTPRQIHLQRALNLATPDYLHLPVATDPGGCKLSKQSGAAPVDVAHPGPALNRALTFLAHPPPEELASAPVSELWDWAIEHWQRRRIPRQLTIAV